MKKITSVRTQIILASVSALALVAASPTPSEPGAGTPPPLACVAPEFRQFDFWLGHWKVTNPQGVQVRTSEITRVSLGCAVREQWQSASGGAGASINYYDAADRQWHQDWVGGDSTILHLHGGLKDGAMILTGETKGAKGPIVNRITCTPLPNGKVKQEWAVSDDAGRNWQISFLGTYKKEN